MEALKKSLDAGESSSVCTRPSGQFVSDAAPGIDGCARFELAIRSDAAHVHTEALVEATERLAIDDLTRVGDFDRVAQLVAQR
jgi:hypothetical protein